MRTVSLTARLAHDEMSTEEVEVALFVVEHPDLAEPLRLSSDPTERLTDDPLVYGTRSTWMGANPVTEPFLFVVTAAELPSDQEDAPAAASFVISNVSPEIAATLRSIIDRPTIHMAVVLASSPNLVEMEVRDLRIVGMEIDADVATLTISRLPIEEELVPTDRFTRERFPGLHR